MIGAGGSSGSLDASNMFKPALARGEIQIIGATTIDEYRKHIEKDGALERRFQKVMVEAASPEETLQILDNIKDKYESHHHVHYTEEAIKACVDLTSRYMTDRFLPDKAIDALDEAGSRVHISNIVVPKEITDIEKKISDIKDKKSQVVRSQKYEEAAKLRDVEKQLQKIIPNQHLILRLVNLINFDTRKITGSKTAINTMIKDLLSKNIITVPSKKIFKDFITMNYFSLSVEFCIKKKLTGIYNLSSGFGTSLCKVARLLILGYGKGIIIKKKINTDSFVLDNKKLYFALKKKLLKKNLYKEIIKIGKKMRSNV
jgi:ATP-dependent Clp protease ATP-binding subunit ClpA